jgi:hypothetical protein
MRYNVPSSSNDNYISNKIHLINIDNNYNKVIANNQIISYEAKDITKCTKSNYKDDIFNILNEQFTSLSVFNTSLYIIYILLAYIILYIIAVIYVRINSYTHILKGELRDIDPKYQLLTIIAIIFISCFIHLLIYKLFFKELSFNKFRQIHNYEIIIDNIINKNLSPINKEYDEDFFLLLTDSTKRNEIDSKFLSKINDIEQPLNNIGKYLFMYDIYMYFDEYIYMNDVVKEDIKSYLKISETSSDRTFISFLDSNERKLIKLYHEDLPFYNQIPSEKLGTFQKINEQVNKEISGINKLILKYSGTFYPFLFACIYIIGIFILPKPNNNFIGKELLILNTSPSIWKIRVEEGIKIGGQTEKILNKSGNYLKLVSDGEKYYIL